MFLNVANSVHDADQRSSNFQILLEGLNIPGSCSNAEVIPEWLDRDLFEKGRTFYRKYLFCIIFSELLGLLASFSFQRILIPLASTKYSDTPKKAMKRYVSTINHISMWYEEDLWSSSCQGHRDIMVVRATHINIAKRLQMSLSEAKLDYERMGEDVPLRYPYNSMIRKDLATPEKAPLNLNREATVFLSQFDMAIIQYSFMGLIVTHPRKMGVWWAKEEDIKGFIHFWKAIGWLLGIHDRYNLCNGTVHDVKFLCLEIEDIILQNLSSASVQYEKMSDALLKGINLFIPSVSFPAIFLYLMATLNKEVSTVRHHLQWKHHFQYLLMRFTFGIVFIIPYFVNIFNYLIKLALRAVNGRAPTWLRFLMKKKLV